VRDKIAPARGESGEKYIILLRECKNLTTETPPRRQAENTEKKEFLKGGKNEITDRRPPTADRQRRRRGN
jgi:hypothetical protein